MLVVSRVSLALLLVACSPAPSVSSTTPTSSTASDTGGTTPPEPEFGVLSVEVEGRTYELELVAEVSLSDSPLATMEWRAEHAGRAARLTAFLIDEQAIAEGTYEVGQWGGDREQFGITLRLTAGGTATVYRTPTGQTTKGSLSLDRLDRTGFRTSTSWWADLEKVDVKGTVVGMERVQSTMVDAPLRIY